MPNKLALRREAFYYSSCVTPLSCSPRLPHAMILSFLLLAALPAVLAQNTGEPIVYDLQHNITSLVGTWSTGSMHVIPGPVYPPASPRLRCADPHIGLCVSRRVALHLPVNDWHRGVFVRPPYRRSLATHLAPPHSSEDGYYEYAQYSFVSNATNPACITGYMLWSHGAYTNAVNGSMFLIPNGDGYQQVQRTCAAVSNFIENNNDTIVVDWWNIKVDSDFGYVLTMQKFDGTYWAPFKQYSTTPNMLPTQKLRNVTLGPDVSVGVRASEARSGARELGASLALMGASFSLGLLSTAISL